MPANSESPSPPPEKRLRILWLLRYPPGPKALGGDAAYSRKLVHYTAGIADVTALSFVFDDTVLADQPGLTWRRVPIARKSKLASLVSGLPSVAHRHCDPAYTAAMTGLAADADVVIVDHIGMFWTVPVLKSALGAACPPIITINHNHEASLRSDMVRGVRNRAFAQALRWDAFKAGRLERAANRAADGLTAITTTDEQAFARDAPATPSLILMPGYDGPMAPARVISDATPRHICILGGRGTFHKQIVLRLILDAILASGLQHRYTFDVVGGGIDEANKQRYPGIVFHGFVEDLAAFFGNIRLGLIPDEVGGGFKLRALTHVFLRVPMLALTRAFTGMPLVAGADFVGCESIEEMVRQAPALVEDTARLNAVQETAFANLRDDFAWSDRAAALVSFAWRLASARGPS